MELVSAPVVTVVVGVYNRASAIVACLDSLLASTFVDYEVVLVEDASTDDSAEVLEQYLAEHAGAPLRLLRNPRNLGASGARNVGVEAACGDLVLFTDSDCVVEPTWIEELVKTFRSTAAAAASGVVLDQAASNLVERAYAGSCLTTAKAPNLMEGNMGFRRSVGVRFDESLFGGEGDDLARRITRAGGRIAFAPAAVVRHHHRLTLSAYVRMAWAIGRGHALYWYKHGLFLGHDILAGGLALSPLRCWRWDRGGASRRSSRPPVRRHRLQRAAPQEEELARSHSRDARPARLLRRPYRECAPHPRPRASRSRAGHRQIETPLACGGSGIWGWGVGLIAWR